MLQYDAPRLKNPTLIDYCVSLLTQSNYKRYMGAVKMNLKMA